jgi:hypothetical protein
MKKLQCFVVGLTLLLACTSLSDAENVVRWASATEALTFDAHSANHVPTQAEISQVYEPLVDFNSSFGIEPSLGRPLGRATISPRPV